MNSIFPPHQLSLFDSKEVSPLPTHARYSDRSGSFVDNMKLPVHRWFRYSAGFSADWVRHLIRDRRRSHDDLIVLDPFAGVGTTLLACDSERVKSIGFEMHPFVFKVARTKLDSIAVDSHDLMSYFDDFYFAASCKPLDFDPDHPPLLLKCYTEESLAKLSVLKETYLSDYAHATPESRLVWLAITSILRSSSSVGTAQWQYVLPKKKKAKVQDPFDAFKTKARELVSDIAFAQKHNWLSLSTIIWADARQPNVSQKANVDLVVTSPPYPNNYDYADATRLEMTFWGEVSGWKDLQSSVRTHLIRSCSQHAAAERLLLEPLLDNEILAPIHDDLSEACHRLAEIRLTKGGRKTYHTMAAAYFTDMAQVFRAIRHLCRSGSVLCFVVGDSAPYGVYLSVDEWLGKLAVAAGFTSYRFEKIRDRNVKWRNRKHRVPLKEGRLWIRG